MTDDATDLSSLASVSGVALALALCAAANDLPDAPIVTHGTEGSAKHQSLPLTFEDVSQAPRDPVALLDQWLSEEGDYDVQTWPAVQAALNEDRLSNRRI